MATARATMMAVRGSSVRVTTTGTAIVAIVRPAIVPRAIMIMTNAVFSIAPAMRSVPGSATRKRNGAGGTTSAMTNATRAPIPGIATPIARDIMRRLAISG